MRICRAIRRATGALAKPLVVAMALGFAIAFAGCARDALPEAKSYPAQLYVKRCGNCHEAYNPHSLTAAMWRVQMKAMQERMHSADMPPLSPRESRIIMEYLERNAGQQ